MIKTLLVHFAAPEYTKVVWRNKTTKRSAFIEILTVYPLEFFDNLQFMDF